MNPTVLVPLAVIAAGLAAAGIGQRRLHPGLVAWVLTAVAAAGAIVTAWVLITLSLGTLTAWCRDGALRPSIPAPLSSASIAWSIVAVYRAWLCERRYRRATALARSGERIVILDHAQPMAYSLPGRRGRIVVSQGMLDALAPPERKVLFAHEQSHVDRRHDRLLHVVELATAVVPPLAFLAHRVRFATERWADEDAVGAVGDRRLVARTIARAALVQAGTVTVGLPLAGLGVRARVEDLLHERPAPHLALAALAITSVVVVAASGVQLHHLYGLAERIC